MFISPFILDNIFTGYRILVSQFFTLENSCTASFGWEWEICCPRNWFPLWVGHHFSQGFFSLSLVFQKLDYGAGSAAQRWWLPGTPCAPPPAQEELAGLSWLLELCRSLYNSGEILPGLSISCSSSTLVLLFHNMVVDCVPLAGPWGPVHCLPLVHCLHVVESGESC